MQVPMSYKFYIRDLNRFESNVITLLQKNGYRVDKIEMDKMMLTKGSFIQDLFAHSPLNRRSRITIDYSDNMVKLYVDYQAKNPKVITRHEQSVWDDFIYRIINSMQSERMDYVDSFSSSKKSQYSIV